MPIDKELVYMRWLMVLGPIASIYGTKNTADIEFQNVLYSRMRWRDRFEDVMGYKVSLADLYEFEDWCREKQLSLEAADHANQR